MRWQGLRKLASTAVFLDLQRRRPPASALAVHLQVDALAVSLALWWPWLLVPFSAPVVWLLTWRRVHKALALIKTPMRVVRVRVGYRIKRPKK